MVRRDQNRNKNKTKKPTATLDLKAEKVSEGNTENQTADELDKSVSQEQKAEAEKKVSDHNSSAKDGDQKPSDQKPGDQKAEAAEEPSDLSAEEITKLVLSQQKTSSGSFFKTMMAAIIGAALALVGQQFMPQLVTSDEIQNSATLSTRLEGLEKQFETVSSKAEQKELKDQLAILQQTFETSTGEGSLDDRVKGLEKTLTDLSALGNSGTDKNNNLAKLTAIATKLNSIEKRVNGELKSLKTDFRKNLRREVEQVAKVIAEQETLSQIESVKLKSETLGKKVASLDAQSSKLVDDVSALNQSLSDVKGASVSSLKLGNELAPLRDALTKVDEKLAQFSKREEEALASARRSALAIAFANLKRGMDRGDGFSSELQTVQQLAGTDVDLTSFDGLRETGVPNEQALLKSFPGLAIKALEKSDTTDKELSWDQLVSKARTAFKYRRTGDVKGETAEAILARIEHKFKEGHVEEALKEANALEGHAKQVMNPWIKQVEARLFVETEMQKLEDQLLNSLSPKS